jgi:hypothetical protein
MTSHFSKPVVVYLSGGKTCFVNSIELAREVLLAWPLRKRGRKYRTAVITILEEQSPDIGAMEQAFREAAEEGGILKE